ncbi:MAG: hypothetical protein WBC91_21365 [Phototrophicaceae bacterium]
MQNAPIQTIFGEVTDFLASNPTPQAIIDYQLPMYLQQRVHELLHKNGEGLLTAEEQKEMMDFSRIDHMLTLLKAKTRLKLKKG